MPSRAVECAENVALALNQGGTPPQCERGVTVVRQSDRLEHTTVIGGDGATYEIVPWQGEWIVVYPPRQIAGMELGIGIEIVCIVLALALVLVITKPRQERRQ